MFLCVIHRIAAELATFETRTKEPFKIDNFHKFIKNHQAMLFPAFQMQLALQRKFLGTSYWESNANRRMDLCDGKYISVGKFILEVRLLACAFLSSCMLDLTLFVYYVYAFTAREGGDGGANSAPDFRQDRRQSQTRPRHQAHHRHPGHATQVRSGRGQ